MNEREILVCPPRDFVWTKLAAGQSQTQTIEEHIDCSPYDQADLVVRVHTDATIPCFVQVNLRSDGFTHDDPGQDFFSDVLGTITLTGDQTAPKYVTDTFTDGLGAMLAVQVVAKQHDSTATTFTARLSIGLVLRKT
ncbi:MAG: hypothetical protein H6719_14735 [Sandaracinaceae bacterium]|nr:hypothetical protein [Sandaracinaceae bacterium]